MVSCRQYDKAVYNVSKNRLPALTQQLEQFPGVFVLDAVYEGQGLYSLKIETPRHTYLDTGTFAEWVSLIQDDLHHAQKPWTCPFCHQRLTEANGSQSPAVSCACRAQGWLVDSTPSDVPNALYHTFISEWTSAQAFTALTLEDRWMIVQESPEGQDFLWIHPDRLSSMSEASEWPAEAPQYENLPKFGTVSLPVYWDDELASESAPQTLKALSRHNTTAGYDDPVRLPTCKTCQYVLEVSSDSGFFDNSVRWCSYPHTTLSSRLEQGNIAYIPLDYARHSVGQHAAYRLHNLILDHALMEFPNINEDEFEGYIQLSQKFYGPICSRYTENPNMVELYEWQRLPVTIPVTFGLVNLAKRDHQQRVQHAADELRHTIEFLKSQQSDPAVHRLMTTRVTQDTRTGPAGQALTTYIRQVVPDIVIQSPYVHELKRFFNVSHAAWNAMLRSLKTHEADTP